MYEISEYILSSMIVMRMSNYYSHCFFFLKIKEKSLREKRFVAMVLFLGAAGIGAAPTVACSGSSTAAVPTNGTVGAAGNTSHPYKCVDL